MVATEMFYADNLFLILKKPQQNDRAVFAVVRVTVATQLQLLGALTKTLRYDAVQYRRRIEMIFFSV